MRSALHFVLRQGRVGCRSASYDGGQQARQSVPFTDICTLMPLEGRGGVAHVFQPVKLLCKLAHGRGRDRTMCRVEPCGAGERSASGKNDTTLIGTLYQYCFSLLQYQIGGM